MEQQSLALETRSTLGKGASRKIRRAGKLPGVLYGLGKNTSVTVDPRLILKLLMTEGGRNKVLSLQGQGLDGRSAIVKDYQVDPLSRKLIHVDLLEIDVTKKITVTVPINIVGKSAGVAEGGVLNHIERTVQVRCLPNQIPAHIDVDVTALNIGDSVHMDDLRLPEGVEKGSHTNPTLVTVVPPTKEEEAAPSLAPTAEPEVITAKKAEPAEGEAAAGAAPAAGAEKKDEKKK
jgi:large subunit ribosomal protein L25